MEKSLDAYQQYSRRNCLLLHGIQQSKGEDTDIIVVEVFNNNMNLNILNPAQKVFKRLRPIIVNFFRYYDRRVVFIYKNFLKGKDKSITEILTAFRMQKPKNVRNEHDFFFFFFFTFGPLMAKQFFKIVIMENRMFTMVQLTRIHLWKMK